MFCLSLFADDEGTCIALAREEKERLQLLNTALQVSNKLKYTSWIRYFREGEGRRNG